MTRLLVADIPVTGKFMVKKIPSGEILHHFDGEGYGDIPIDIAVKEVVNVHNVDGYIILEVLR